MAVLVRKFWLIMVLVIGLGPSVTLAQADDQTLADIRQELEFLYAEIVSLKREMSTTGDVGLQSTSGPALQRLDALEAELRRLTGAVEEKQFDIDAIVRDGTNRVGDLEFRLCELEPACDIANLDRTEPLGGKLPDRAVQTTQTTETDTSGATDAERVNFQRAMAAYEAGDFGGAETQFEAIIANFPDGPLTGEAHYWRGESLAGIQDWSRAARSFLESFSGSPAGTKAPDALYRLGISLRELQQPEEACLMLGEVSIRYPTSAIAGQAQADYAGLGCS